jgi:hypothetical protein
LLLYKTPNAIIALDELLQTEQDPNSPYNNFRKNRVNISYFFSGGGILAQKE